MKAPPQPPMGNIVEKGTVGQVLNDPKHPYTKALLKSIPVLGKGKEQELNPIKGSTPDPYNKFKGCQFAPRCDYASEICQRSFPDEKQADAGHMFRCHNVAEKER